VPAPDLPSSPRPIHQRPRESCTGLSKLVYQLTPIVTGTGGAGIVVTVSGHAETWSKSVGVRRPRGFMRLFYPLRARRP
jgi:hypothetical protein